MDNIQDRDLYNAHSVLTQTQKLLCDGDVILRHIHVERIDGELVGHLDVAAAATGCVWSASGYVVRGESAIRALELLIGICVYRDDV